eukprot:14620101-Ditylum_brightwellii.AAC.1
MALAAEAELGALFENTKESVSLCSTLTELWHQQPATPIQVDYLTAHRIVNSNICHCKSKAIDMGLYWVKDRVTQGQFQMYWEPGRNNKTDYFTKHHPLAHHKSTLQGCAALSLTHDTSNLDIEERDYGQSTIYMSATSLAIEQVRRSLRLIQPMAQGVNRFPS